MPERPSFSADQNASTEWPSAETQPSPVTTTFITAAAHVAAEAEFVPERDQISDGFDRLRGLVGVERDGDVVFVLDRS